MTSYTQTLESENFYDWILAQSTPEKNTVVLDAGCGEGVLALKLSKQVRAVVALDIDQEKLDVLTQRAAKEKIAIQETTLQATQSTDALQGLWLVNKSVHQVANLQFDVIYTLALANSIGVSAPSDQAAYLRGEAYTNLFSLLKPGGVLVDAREFKNKKVKDSEAKLLAEDMASEFSLQFYEARSPVRLEVQKTRAWNTENLGFAVAVYKRKV